MAPYLELGVARFEDIGRRIRDEYAKCDRQLPVHN